MEKKNPNDGQGKPFLIVTVAVVIVAILSLFPWSRMTGGRISDFNLLADLFETSDTSVVDAGLSMPPDPILMQAIADNQADSIEDEHSDTEEEYDDEDALPPEKIAVRDSSGVLPIEDYTVGESGLGRFKESIARGQLTRIAILGDSYIEGDIFSQDVRALLQQQYGGSGVGYVNMYSEFPGFRRSVNQSGSGWTAHLAGQKGTDGSYIGISESYFTPDGHAVATYKGTKKVPRTDIWSRSKFLCIAPDGASIVLSSGEKSDTFILEPSSAVKALEMTGSVSSFKVSLNSTSVVGLGVWLDSESGVAVDCMSARGFSGVSLQKVNVELCREMARYVDYDLIILEYGLNAMSAGQKNFSVYSNQMVAVVEHLRECYPNAEFLIMSIGDRGENKGGEIKSMSSVRYMIEAQRDAARKARCLFWDTREAQGGEDAIAEWAKNGYINKDYIHMSHKGGAKLAELFVTSLNQLLQ